MSEAQPAEHEAADPRRLSWEYSQNIGSPISPSIQEGATFANGLKDAAATSPIGSSQTNSRAASRQGSVPAASSVTVPAMYWARMPIGGTPPSCPLRSHTVSRVGDMLYYFGGINDHNQCQNDMYAFDTDMLYWTRVEPSGEPPGPCRTHSAVTLRRRIVVFGGGVGNDCTNDVHTFDTDLMAWSKLKATGDIPCPRRAHAAWVYDNDMYVFGGASRTGALDEVYKLSINEPVGAVWSKLETTGSIPSPRGYHSATVIHNKVVVIGGSDGEGCFSDVYLLDLDKLHWTEIRLDPRPRFAHSATQVGSYIFVIGGHDGEGYGSEVLALNLITMDWEERKVFGIPIAPRGYHTAMLHDSRIFVHGGYNGDKVFSDTTLIELSGSAYLPQVTNFDISV